MQTRVLFYILIGIGIGQSGCKLREDVPKNFGRFNSSMLKLNTPVKQIKGQTLYLPVYSSIPYAEGKSFYGLSAFVAIHNTDKATPIRLVSVYYLDTDGNLVKDFLEGRADTVLPFQTISYFVPESDKSGVGSNFILEWIADSAVNEPLIESIMVSLTSGQGVSFLSEGKIVNEIK